MRIDPEDLRRHYESLSDEGFLDIDRSDLAPVAQGIYDQEIARRGLDHPPEQEMEAFHRPLPIFKVGAAVKLGAAGYVRKPFTADQIKEKLAGILESARPL